MTDQNAPYLKFGLYLYSLRESLGVRTEAIAEFLGKSVREYVKFEFGYELPTNQELQKIAEFLKHPLKPLKDASLQTKRQIGIEEPEEISGVLTLSDDFNAAWEKTKLSFKKRTGHELTLNQTKIVGLLKHDMRRIFVPPALPVNMVMILGAIKRNENKARFLRDIKDFICQGEDLPGYLARDYWGGYLHYMANLFLFSDNPSKSILDSMNRLEINQFKELSAIGFFESGIYSDMGDLPILQKLSDFDTLATMFARELRSVWPKEINSDHLEMAVSLQGCGHHILYTCLQPSIMIGAGDKTATDDAGVYRALTPELFETIIFECHAAVTAGLLSQWQFPWEILDTLVTHHDQPIKDVSPLCAAFKFVNVLTNQNFQITSEAHLKKILEDFPQLQTLSINAVFEVLKKMNAMKDHFFERSSMMVANASQQAFSLNERDASRSTDIRLKFEFQRNALPVAVDTSNDLLKEILSPRRLEKMSDFLERIKIFHLRRLYARHRDVQNLSADFKMSEDEIKHLLKIKR